MSASILPDTNIPPVIEAAIAFEIVHKAFPVNKDQSDEGGKKYILKVTNIYIKVYSAIHTQKSLKAEDLKLD